MEPAGPALPPDEDVAEVPVIGQIAAGFSQEAVELAEEMFRLPRRLVGHGTLFMLRVRGDSMTGAAITDGDLVVVRPAAGSRERRDRRRLAEPGPDTTRAASSGPSIPPTGLGQQLQDGTGRQVIEMAGSRPAVPQMLMFGEKPGSPAGSALGLGSPGRHWEPPNHPALMPAAAR